MLVGLESAYKEKDKTGNESYIGEMQANFLEQEPIVDFDFYYNAVKQIIPTITVEEVSARAKEWNTDKNRQRGSRFRSVRECQAPDPGRSNRYYG